MGSDPIYLTPFILTPFAQTLTAQRKAIGVFLRDHLALEVHRHKTVMQRCTQGLDFLGAIVNPHHKLTRQRSVRALRCRLAGFTHMVFAQDPPGTGSLGLQADKACGTGG